ncbi:MAG: sugar phosphate isomerase/epimerase family protein [Christensenellales bacterium]|jgi:sugar phosphate isomerase/epimerase
MILSCLPVSLFPEIISGRMTVGEWAAAARSMGLDAVDLSILFIPHRTTTGIARIKHQLQEASMPVAMITTYPDLTNPDERRRAFELAHAESDIAIAAELDATYLRITAGQVHEGLTDKDGISLATEGIAQLCHRASEWGVQLLLENHSKPSAWDNPDFDFHTGRFLKLVEALWDLPVGINFDTANTYALGDDSAEVFQKVYDKVMSIHINDILDTESLQFVGIGDGTAPIGQILSIAKAKGFDGLLSIEEVGNEGLIGIRRSVERSRELWKNA